MNFSGIEEICKNVDMGQNAYVYLMDGNGEIIYHPRQQLIYSNLIEETNYKNAKLEDGHYLENFQGHKRMINIKTVGYTCWKIDSVSTIEDILSGC